MTTPFNDFLMLFPTAPTNPFEILKQKSIAQINESIKLPDEKNPITVDSDDFIYCLEHAIVGEGKLMVVKKIYPPPSSSYKTGWVLGDFISNCMICNGVFGVFNWQHHCRACGYVVCSFCSPFNVSIPECVEFGELTSRVCNNCFGLKPSRKSVIGPNVNSPARSSSFTSSKLSSSESNSEKVSGFKFLDDDLDERDEFVKKTKAALKNFEASQLSRYEEAYTLMRKIIPVDISKLSVPMMIKMNIPAPVARRLWEKKTLWLIVMHKDDISKIHIADLRGKFQFSYLDIVEMRAISHVLPDWGQDNPKADWKDDFKRKLNEYAYAETLGKLNDDCKRNKAYEGLEPLEIFDPKVEIISKYDKEHLQKSYNSSLITCTKKSPSHDPNDYNNLDDIFSIPSSSSSNSAHRRATVSTDKFDYNNLDDIFGTNSHSPVRRATVSMNTIDNDLDVDVSILVKDKFDYNNLDDIFGPGSPMKGATVSVSSNDTDASTLVKDHIEVNNHGNLTSNAKLFLHIDDNEYDVPTILNEPDESLEVDEIDLKDELDSLDSRFEDSGDVDDSFIDGTEKLEANSSLQFSSPNKNERLLQDSDEAKIDEELNGWSFHSPEINSTLQFSSPNNEERLLPDSDEAKIDEELNGWSFHSPETNIITSFHDEETTRDNIPDLTNVPIEQNKHNSIHLDMSPFSEDQYYEESLKSSHNSSKSNYSQHSLADVDPSLCDNVFSPSASVLDKFYNWIGSPLFVSPTREEMANQVKDIRERLDNQLNAHNINFKDVEVDLNESQQEGFIVIETIDHEYIPKYTMTYCNNLDKLDTTLVNDQEEKDLVSQTIILEYEAAIAALEAIPKSPNAAKDNFDVETDDESQESSRDNSVEDSDFHSSPIYSEVTSVVSSESTNSESALILKINTDSTTDHFQSSKYKSLKSPPKATDILVTDESIDKQQLSENPVEVLPFPSRVDAWSKILIGNPDELNQLAQYFHSKEKYPQDDFNDVFGPDKANELLLQCAGDPDCLSDALSTFKFLVEVMKADVNIRDIDGRTALGILFNNSLLGRYLLSRGADVFIKDDKGQNALEICLEYGETWLLEEFQKLGGEMSILNDSKKMFDYVKILMITGLASRAVNFIDKGYIFIDPSTASSLMKQAQGNFANMVEPIETFELLTRLGADVEL